MNRPQQSPINLTGAIQATFSKNYLQLKWPKAIVGVLEEEHGKREVTFQPDNRNHIIVDGQDFVLRGFHFHHRSEHWVEGKQHPMELHIVHQNIDSHERVVLAVFLEPEATKKTKKVRAKACPYDALNQADCDQPISINPRDWLPENLTDFYRYEGSLTTPEYDENVRWLIFNKPLSIDRSALNRLKKCFGKTPRFPQPLNRRFLLASFKI